MARLKTFGILLHVPLDWPIEGGDNHQRQRQVIVATTSYQKALEAFQKVGGRHLTLNYLRTYGYGDMRGRASEAATAQPGVVLWSPSQRDGPYVPVPTPETNEGAQQS